MTLKLCQLKEYSIRNICMINSRARFNVGKKNRHRTQGILLQIRNLERELCKSFNKINFFFLSNRMSSICDLYVIHMSLLCTRMSLVCTRISSSLCHSYVLVCHSYVTRLWFYHEPFFVLYVLICTFFKKTQLFSIVIIIFYFQHFQQ